MTGVSASTGPGPPRRDGRVRALVSPREAGAGPDPGGVFRERFGLAPERTLETSGWTVHLAVAGPVEQGSDADGAVDVLVQGELLPDGPTTAAGVAERWTRGGEEGLPALNGSFGLLVADRVDDRVVLVADRMASRRFYVSRAPSGWFVTTDLADHPTAQCPVDPLAVAWYLASGFLVNYRTPYQGVDPVERAHVLELGRDGATARRYWSCRHLEPLDPPSTRALKAGLEERLVEAVRRRVDDGSTYLSLSGGIDSVGIAVILAARLGRTDVQAFSYALGDAAPETDAGCARAVCQALGLPHRVVNSYAGDFMEHMRVNALWGQATAMPIHEVATWRTLGNEPSVDPPAGILAGDENFGYGPVSLHGPADVVANIKGRVPAFAPAAVRTLPAGLYEAMRSGTRSDLEALADRYGADPDLRSRWECVGLDQMSCHLMPWRERFQSRFFRVRNPWLDSDVMDYMAAAPWAARLEKGLFRQVIADMCPEQPGFPLPSREGFRTEYGPEVRANAGAIRDWIQGTSSRLDEVLPTSFGLALLDQATEGDLQAWGRYTRHRARRWLAARGLGTTPESTAPPHKTLRRYAILRMAL